MKKLIMELRKRNRETGLEDYREMDMTPFLEFLTLEEVFAMEFKLNEIPSIRVHLSIGETGEL